MFPNPNPYRASIGGHKASESPFVPPSSHPFRRRWFEAWDMLSAEIHQDTADQGESLPPGKAFWFRWRAESYALSEGEAAGVCDAWAHGTLLAEEGGRGVRLQIVDDLLRSLSERVYNPDRPN